MTTPYNSLTTPPTPHVPASPSDLRGSLVSTAPGSPPLSSSDGSMTDSLATLAPVQHQQPEYDSGSSSAHPTTHHAPYAYEKRPRGVLAYLAYAALHTPPSFFAINMGTGIVSILLHNFPYPARWLQYLGTIVFVLNVVIFVALFSATIARYCIWSGVFMITAKHNLNSMFWGTFPMGFVTIVNMIAIVCVPAWGSKWASLALGLWWIDIAVAVLVNFGTVFLLFTKQHQTELSVSPAWLLPVVSTVVAAASGSIVAQSLMPFNPNLARATLLASYVIWGTGVPLAFMVITIVVYRMALHGPPPHTLLASVFLPLGPCAQGAFGIVNMGVTARQLAYEHSTPIIPGMALEASLHIADAMYAGGIVAGLILWGLALLWYTLGIALFLDGWRKDWSLLGTGKFTVGYWSLTFPIGVFSTASLALGTELQSTAFKVIAAFLAVQVVLHWIFVSVGTLWTFRDGTLFSSQKFETEDAPHIGQRWHREDWPKTHTSDIEARPGKQATEVACEIP